SISNGPQTAFCDRTQDVEAFLCFVGVMGAHATSPVILGVTYDSLRLTAHVVDGDSTPGRNDGASGTANLSMNQPPDPYSALPMLDDGSTTALPAFTNDPVTLCTEDPVAGVCNCVPQEVPAYSGDASLGDGIYTRGSSLIFPGGRGPFDDARAGCVIQ